MKNKLTLLSAALILAACSTEQPPAPAGESVAQTVAPQPKMPEFDPSAAPVSQVGFNGNDNVRRFVESEAQNGRYSRNELQTFFNGAVYKSNIISIMNRPGTSRPWYEFQKSNAGSAKISDGRNFYMRHRQVLEQISREYGVPAEVIAAVIGIETNYGRNMGSFRLADSLSTLAFDYPRRAGFFQKELHEMLLMAKEENQDPFWFAGSYAGAMGLPQFMPSSYRKWAVDYDRDGRRDIWGSVPDAAASVANYLKAHGWKTGGRMVVPVLLTPSPQIQAVIDEKTELKHTVGELRAMGVEIQTPIADHERAILYRLEVSPGLYEYYIGLNNFYAVWQYNHSRMYVTAVRDIANGIGADNL
ncbi:Membrane-bound lytic murein transglycosylase B precursor [Kingella potus]|uniref:Membrane-bound lytic murein transglycosylase B n=1 Tax=Kingella potus TaxID=265175 RepID=A0A377R418_9NEIS|nr:lytic murein transglycosylase B [Kingella potus]STR03241.1 Membrane-bound lytic murein transglycosylase B precursor [Kingella potus]